MSLQPCCPCNGPAATCSGCVCCKANRGCTNCRIGDRNCKNRHPRAPGTQQKIGNLFSAIASRNKLSSETNRKNSESEKITRVQSGSLLRTTKDSLTLKTRARREDIAAKHPEMCKSHETSGWEEDRSSSEDTDNERERGSRFRNVKDSTVVREVKKRRLQGEAVEHAQEKQQLSEIPATPTLSNQNHQENPSCSTSPPISSAPEPEGMQSKADISKLPTPRLSRDARGGVGALETKSTEEAVVKNKGEIKTMTEGGEVEVEGTKETTTEEGVVEVGGAMETTTETGGVEVGGGERRGVLKRRR